MLIQSLRTHRFSSWVTGLVPLLGVLATPAFADTITVCWDGSGDYVTIQEGIDAAVDGDEVVVCDGTYTGLGNKNLDFAGKAITVRSASGDPQLCIIDCEGEGRGFYFHSGETSAAVVDGFTITNGNGDISPWGGGAIACEASSNPTIRNCRLTGNTAGLGGGVFCDESDPTIAGCTISNNAAIANDQYTSGGGVYCKQSSLVIRDTLIEGNTARNGGGIYCDRISSPLIENCTVTGNTAVGASCRGAGIFCDEGEATIRGCDISSNTILAENSYGAGLYLLGGSPTITGCRITDNRAEQARCYGGGVYCAGAQPIISNCLIAGNLATAAGGGVMCYASADPLLVNNEIVLNSPSGVSSQSYSNPVVVSCTFALNGAWGIAGSRYSSATVTNCILWWDAITGDSTSQPTVSYCDVHGGWPGEGNIDADPLFVDPDGPDDDLATWQDNDYRLAPGSPCIDAGNNEAVPDGITTDLAGKPRFIDDPATDDTGAGTPPIVDMGAYEFQIPGDLNGDNCVDQADLGILLADWGCTSDCVADLDGDDDTDQSDLGILLAHWGAGCL